MMIPAVAVSAVSAFAVILAPVATPAPAAVCAAHLDGGVFKPAWCGKKPPPKAYEKYRKALAAFQTAYNFESKAQATAIGDLSPLEYPCRNNPPVDVDTVSVIIGGLRLNGDPALSDARKALSTMTSTADAVFDGHPEQPEVKAVLLGLQGKLDELGANIVTTENAAYAYMANSCDAGSAGVLTAADPLVSVGQFINHSIVNLATMLGQTHKPCKSASVRKSYSDKAMKNASGSSSVKSVTAGGMTLEYPGSLDLDKGLPFNLDSDAASGYVQVVLSQGPKALAAVGGGTPSGESGIRLKVLGKAKPGAAKLQLIFSPAGGTEVSRTVKIRLRPGR